MTTLPTPADRPPGDLAGRVAAALAGAPPRAGRTRVLALDGPSGAGKTTLARTLASSPISPSGPPAVVHLDAIYPGWDGLSAGVERLVEGVLRPLAEGRPAGWHRWDWMRGRDGRWCPLPAAPPLLLVEGVGAGARACAPYLSVLVWVEAPAAVRYARAMARDGDGYRPHWDRWAAQEAAYLAADDPRARADLRLDTGPSDPRDTPEPPGR